MTADDELLGRVYDSLYGHLALGNHVIEEPLARFVHNAEIPNVQDANHVTHVRATTTPDIDSVLARSDELHAHSPHRRFFIDPWTPAAFEARLALDGYEEDVDLVLVLLLEGELTTRSHGPAGLELRPLETDADHDSFEWLLRLDHDEEAVAGRPRSGDLTRQLAAVKRDKAPDACFYLARVNNTDCAFFSSWPGTNGVGIVEDLFTHPEFRHRGIATALITHCVDDARSRGAGPVVISALVADTPKDMYVALGFRPVCVNRNWLLLG